jgi:helix-turn-helix protein
VGRPRGRPLAPLIVDARSQRLLEQWSKSGTAPPWLAERARVVLACAAGASNNEVAAQLGTSPQRVGRWRARWLAGGAAALVGAPRNGAPARVGPSALERLEALQAEPSGRARSTRALATSVGVSQSTAVRLERVRALRPASAVSTAAWTHAAAIVGVHLHLADRVLVLAADAPAAPSPVDGWSFPRALWPRLHARVREIAAHSARTHGGVKLRRFLRAVDQAVPPPRPLHVVVDRAPRGVAARWLARRPRYRVHASATESLWWLLLSEWSAAPGTAALEHVALALGVLRWLHTPARGAQPFRWLGS